MYLRFKIKDFFHSTDISDPYDIVFSDTFYGYYIDTTLNPRFVIDGVFKKAISFNKKYVLYDCLIDIGVYLTYIKENKRTFITIGKIINNILLTHLRRKKIKKLKVISSSFD